MKKVLIVDDSKTDLKHLEQILHAAHYRTVTAMSGREAILKARQEQPDVILMDIIMEDMDGFSTCREMTHDPELKEIPVVFVSSKNQRVDHIWAAKQGAKALVSKPYGQEDILNQVQHYAS